MKKDLVDLTKSGLGEIFVVATGAARKQVEIGVRRAKLCNVRVKAGTYTFSYVRLTL